jgi:hypothetical protein
MPLNSQKLWFQRSLNDTAIGRAEQAIRSTGRALPCRVVAVQGALVTVAFEVDASPWTLPQLTLPKAEASWMRVPTQVGDLGITMACDTYLGGISGISSGVATLTRRGNLSSLVFVPVSNKNAPPIDQNAVQLSGPNGAIIQTEDGTAKIVVNESGITLTFGGKTVTLNSAGLTIDGILFDTHTHTYSPGTNPPTETGGPQG